jgi:hypothetical protein
LIKKVLVFNYAGPEHIKEVPSWLTQEAFSTGSLPAGWNRGPGWQQSIASLMEGIISLSGVTVFSTTPLNYGYKVPLKNSERKKHISFLNNIYYSYVIDEESYVAECENIAEECDVIIIMEEENPGNVVGDTADDRGGKWGTGRSHPTTYFRNEEGEVVKHLHHYMIVNHRDKVVFLETGDDRQSPYRAIHPECQPPYYKIFFKREKELGKIYSGNVVSAPFAAEEIYFTGGKHFDKIWHHKKLDMVSLFRGKDNSRRSAKDILVKNFKNNSKCIVDYLSLGFSERNILTKPGFGNMHKEESEAFLQACISVDGEPGHGCYYTDRMFKSLAAGCCLFLPTPAYSVDFPNGFKDGTDVIIYDKENLNDLIEKIKYYLNNKEELKRIAKNGFNKLLKYHTSEVRSKEFIKTCERYISD